MAKTRRVEKVWKSKPTVEGAGVHLRRAFGVHEVPQLDLFLLLDDFRSNEPREYQRGFPWHPHRGMETTEKQPVRFLLVAGRPLKEPVAWYGPIVMNTQAELRAAFREYEQLSRGVDNG